MARIFKHPGVEDYFVDFDYQVRQDGWRKQLMEDYECGKVILLRNAKLEFDAPFLSSLSVPQQCKKLKSVPFVRKFFEGRVDANVELYEWFKNDIKQYTYLAKQVRDVNKQIMVILYSLFPEYEVTEERITWRLLETINENLHVDIYKQEMPDHHVRMFVNLDIIPRIWQLSYNLDFLLANQFERLDLDTVKRSSASEICHALNFAAFKGYDLAGREGCPKHIVFFEPGDVWLVDSRKVSHQILYGRRALSTECVVKVMSMSDPAKHYLSLVDELKNKARNARSAKNS